MLFGAEIFNLPVPVVVPEPSWKLHICAMYKPRQVVICKCLPVLAQKLAHCGFYLLNEECCIQYSSDGKLSNGFKIAAIYLVFIFRILENSCRHSALFTALFTMGGGISM